jgi:hypothetical protein
MTERSRPLPALRRKSSLRLTETGGGAGDSAVPKRPQREERETRIRAFGEQAFDVHHGSRPVVVFVRGEQIERQRDRRDSKRGDWRGGLCVIIWQGMESGFAAVRAGLVSIGLSDERVAVRRKRRVFEVWCWRRVGDATGSQRCFVCRARWSDKTIGHGGGLLKVILDSLVTERHRRGVPSTEERERRDTEQCVWRG